jgi:NADH:ubiquinone oxidoreductase subunit E
MEPGAAAGGSATGGHQDAKRLVEIVGRYPRGDPGSLVNALHDLQAEFGYLSEQAMRVVAQHLGMPKSEVFGVATFYQGFHVTPRGRHTCTVCTGTACHVRGAPRLLEQLERDTGLAAGETAADLSLTVDEVGCIGACALGPLVVVDGEYHGHMTSAALSKLARGLLGGTQAGPAE